MRVALGFLVSVAWLGCASETTERPIDNLHELAPGVFSGAVPHGDDGYRALARLGVRTVISVDGARPDLDAAKRHGLRYVHLPIGYDGIPQDRAMELGKALQDLPGPVYLHCHHGKHRGPAAAAVACVVAGKLDNDQAIAVMKGMGTGEQYLGLWASARSAKPADPATLRDLKVDYRDVAAVPPLTQAMTALDEAFGNLELSREAGWKTPSGHPDVDPAHEALRAREILSEILRTDELQGRPRDFQDWMKGARAAAAELESHLRTGSVSATKSFDALRRSCADCHKPYRNAPRK